MGNCSPHELVHRTVGFDGLCARLFVDVQNVGQRTDVDGRVTVGGSSTVRRSMEDAKRLVPTKEHLYSSCNLGDRFLVWRHSGVVTSPV